MQQLDTGNSVEIDEAVQFEVPKKKPRLAGSLSSGFALWRTQRFRTRPEHYTLGENECGKMSLCK